MPLGSTDRGVSRLAPSGQVSRHATEEPLRGPATEPFFIVGPRRSGTSLLAKTLDGHPRLAVYFESYFFPIFAPLLGSYGDLRSPAAMDALLADVGRIATLQGHAFPGVERLRARVAEPTPAAVLGALIDLYAEQRGKSRGGEKTPEHALHLPALLSGFPDARVFFMMRDPRDTALSQRRAFGTSAVGAIAGWNAAWDAFRAAADRVRLVRYEALVSDPEGTVAAVCADLGEPWDPELLRIHERAFVAPRRGLSRSHHRRLLEPIDPRSVGRFDALPARDLARIEAGCAEGMAALGYPPTQTVRRVARPGPLATRAARLADELRFYVGRPRRFRRALARRRMALARRARGLLGRIMGPVTRRRAARRERRERRRPSPRRGPGSGRRSDPA